MRCWLIRRAGVSASRGAQGWSVRRLQDAVVRARTVRLVCTDHAGARSERVVALWGLVDKDDKDYVWYLIAGTERGRRTFRNDRVVEATATEDAAERPADFELGEAWREVVEHVEQRRSFVRATVVAQERHVPVLRTRFGRQCTVGNRVDRARVRVQVAAPTPLSIAQQLAGWGALVEVEASETVRAELARLGAELVQRYHRSETAPDVT